VDIGRTDILGSYWREVNFALPNGDGAILREARADLAAATLGDAQLLELADLDESVIDSLLTLEIQGYLLADVADAPLVQWWWHLGALHDHSYPADLLPAPLRAIYLDRSAAQ